MKIFLESKNVIKSMKNTIPEFNRVCYILGEYGSSQKMTSATPNHFKEHYKMVIEDEAVQTLSAL